MLGKWWNRAGRREPVGVGGAAVAAGPGAVAAGGDIGIAVTGHGNSVYVGGAPRVAVSDYRFQVESVAAAEFREREEELAAMAAFCRAPEATDAAAAAYWRWLARAWAGKTALMAEFVLHPPPDVDVVSFFITSRLNRQNNRAAFCEVVHRQLYALLGQEEPAVTEYTREESLRAAMERAAASCAARGRRLVLVVDGLDEDRGVLAGPDSHSIAALLPRAPSHGMRVIVAGRPHPPVPVDVPAGHPLRDSSIDRWLPPSAFAEAVRQEAEDSLLRMLDGGGLARDLLGLVTAAGGGLTAADLSALARTQPRLVERELATVTGRAFRMRTAHWSSREGGHPADGVYVLAHEEIQSSALELMSDGELTVYRERLHAWAAAFHEQRWPAHTPEYLLRGYSQLLRTQQDTARLVRLAGDAHRHTRLWQRTGSDLDALSELAAAFGSLRADGRCEPRDVGDAFMLALRRDALRSRSESLPDALIAVWASLGHVRRAVGLARARQEVLAQLRAFGGVVQSLVAAGDPAQAAEVAVEAAELAAAVPEQRREEATEHAVALLAVAGHHHRAIDVARTLPSPAVRDQVLAGAAVSALRAGQRASGTALARAAASSVPDIVAVSTVMVMIMSGRYAEAVTETGTVGDTELRVHLLRDIATAMAENGLSADAVAVSWKGLTEGADAAPTAGAVALAHAGALEQAVELARSPADPYTRMESLAGIATALVTSGAGRSGGTGSGGTGSGAGSSTDTGAGSGSAGTGTRSGSTGSGTRSGSSGSGTGTGTESRAEAARKLALEAAALADGVTADNLRARGLTMAAQALALAGRPAQAVDLLKPLRSPREREEAVADVVAALASTPEGLAAATSTARNLTLSASRSRALAHVAWAHLRAGRHEQAAELAREASDATRQDTALGEPYHLGLLCRALAESDAPDLVVGVARGIGDPDARADALVDAACDAARRGLHSAGADIARAIADPYRRGRALGWVSSFAARGGSLELAETLLREMDKAEDEQPPRSLRSYDHRKAALSALARALTDAGRDDAAHALTETAPHTWDRAELRAAIARGLIARGEDERALALVRDFAASPRAPRAVAPVTAAWAAAGSVPQALAALGALPDAAAQAEALSLAASSLTRDGHATQAAALAPHARALADGLTTPPWLDPNDVAAATAGLAWTGELDQARTLARQLDESYVRDETIAAVAEAMAVSGRYEEGVELADSLPEPLMKGRVLADIAHWAARRGDFGTAVRTGAAIGHSEHQDWALLATVDCAVREHRFAEAVEAARALTEPRTRVRALCAVDAAARRHGEDAFAGVVTGDVVTGDVVTGDVVSGELEREASGSTDPEDGIGVWRCGLKAAAAEGWGDSARGRSAAVEALSLGPWHRCLSATRSAAPQALAEAVRAVLHDGGA
ncbi:hypothetical protein [Streptomyces neyagawaensis]|uniref:NACHT domain-containing protein n=1 Tax=Streptomyces neyagawaensis TaxID=42238 RepID=A0ABV3B1Y7_9ACTN